MSDIEAIKTSVKELAEARKEKERKLKEGVKAALAHRRTLREQSNRPA